MPYLLQIPSALIWRRNDVFGLLLVQYVNPVLMTEASRALKSVMLYQRFISNVQWQFLAAISLIVLFINRLISHMRLSPRYGRKMLSRTAGQWLRHSHGNHSHASLLNRFSFQEISIMKSAMVLAVYCSLLRNILLTGSQRCHLLSWLFILNGIGACSFAKTQRPVDK